jgi:hypothetical protein
MGNSSLRNSFVTTTVGFGTSAGIAKVFCNVKAVFQNKFLNISGTTIYKKFKNQKWSFT